MKRTTFGFLTAAGLGVAALAWAADTLPVAYPDGYRDWTHVKSMYLGPEHPLADPFEGLHHTYANPLGLEGLKSGAFDDGAVLVFDLLQFDEDGAARVEGQRKFIGVMAYDAEAYAATGGWGFEAFAGDSRTERLVEDGGLSCFGCHASQRDTGYVFTRYRE